MTKNSPTLHELYPSLNEQELKEAEENLERYVAIVLRIYERLCAERELADKPPSFDISPQ